MARNADHLIYENVLNVVDLFKGGMIRQTDIANKLGLSRSTVSKILKRYRENPEQIIERERQCWMLRQRGWTHQQIADELGVARSTVSMILARVTKRILETMGDEVRQAKVQQWAQLDYIIEQSLEAWRSSKDPAKQVTKREEKSRDLEALRRAVANAGIDPATLPESIEEILTTRVVDQDGDTVYLREARAAMADLRKLLGIDAPTKIAQTDPSGENAAPIPTGGQVIILIPDNGRDDNDTSASGTANEVPGDSS